MKCATSAIIFFLAICANAQWTVVNLHPAGATFSDAYGVGDGEQMGTALIGIDRASLWSGTAGSWVDLHPAGATISFGEDVHGGQQVGYAEVGGVGRASLWSGTAASWVDLMPAGATRSYAYGVHSGRQVGWTVVGGIYRARPMERHGGVVGEPEPGRRG